MTMTPMQRQEPNRPATTCGPSRTASVEAVIASAARWMANLLSDWLAIDHRDGTIRVRFRFCR
jgi:hypothetical protein